MHEAYQFMMLKKMKKSGRSMSENWTSVGGKASLLNAATLSLKKEPAEV